VTNTAAVEVVGAERLAATLSSAGGDIAHPTAAASEAGRVLARQGSSNAPRRTGRLASSIRARPSGGDVEVGSSLIYAPVIHNGWARHHITANPFLRHALEQRTGEIVALYARDMDKAISQVKGA
jgi:hypothetical protein